MFLSRVILVLHATQSAAKWNSRSHCSVHNNQLYAHGIYIRPLNEDEKAEEAKYNSQMNFYKEALKKTCAINENELLKRPMTPPLPSFCHSYDVTKFVLPGCSVLNDRVYAGGHFLRKLTINETYALKEFMIQSKHYEVYVRDKQKQVNFASSLFQFNSSMNKHNLCDITLKHNFIIENKRPPRFANLLIAKALRHAASDARMGSTVSLVVVERPKAPHVCGQQEIRPKWFCYLRAR
uniref:Pepsin inhibitor-3-like repeated domain-containing protein n=1 Tax=Ascaris lumbricoides TaxID=6252 RepID=A0A0M3I821_ASCLU